MGLGVLDVHGHDAVVYDINGDGIGTPVTYTGQSYYTNQAIATQLTGINTGR